MQVTQISTAKTSQSLIFSADFIFDKPFGGKKEKIIFWCKWLYHTVTNPTRTYRFGFKIRKRIWYEISKKFADENNARDAFYLIALPLAIATNENLLFDGKVSAEVLKKTRAVERYYHEVSKRKIKVSARCEAITNKIKTADQNVGQFFTLGVDSFYTLSSKKSKNGQTSQNLIYVDGYDIPFYQKKFLTDLHKKIDKVAKKTEHQAIFVTTNLRSLSDSIIGWGRFHVSALVAASYFLKQQKVYISGESFEAADWGLRYGVDKLYSTAEKNIEVYGHNINRNKKIKKIIASKNKNLFLNFVRVCWENVREKDLQYNCSKCQKCLKTKLSLMTLAVTKTPTFLPIAVNDLEKIHLVEHVYEEWLHLYQSLKKQNGIDSNIVLAIEKILKKPLRV